MIAYGGRTSNLSHVYILYDYALHDRRRDHVRVSSIAAALWFPATWVASSTGGIDAGDAELPGRYAMLIRSVTLGTFLLTLYGNPR